MVAFQKSVQLCQKLLIRERSNPSQGLNLISQLTLKLQACFVFTKNLHQITAGEHPVGSCPGPLTGSLCPTGEHRHPARHRPPIYWVTSWLPHCPNTAQTSEENQGTFGTLRYPIWRHLPMQNHLCKTVQV